VVGVDGCDLPCGGGGGASARWKRSTDATSCVEVAAARSLIVRQWWRAGRLQSGEGVEAAALCSMVLVRQHAGCYSFFST
jgi:hypothetical protein